MEKTNYISCAIAYYGKENFEVSLIKQVPDDEWAYWEMYYINEYQTHFSMGGYNLTFGGDSNPMDIQSVKDKHHHICTSEEFREKQRQLSLGKTHSEETKELCRRQTLSHLDQCIAGFRAYNESRKIKVGMVDDDGNLLMSFDSLSDACRYCGSTTPSYTSRLKYYADKINKNGKRAKFLGYSWTLL